MRFTSFLIKLAIKLTPSLFIIWASNFILKGIAKFHEFEFDLESRVFHVKVQLYGEVDTIEVWMEDFMVTTDGESYAFFLRQAHSDRPWLTNILAIIAGKSWKIPAVPALAPYMGLVSDLLKAPVQSDNAPTDSRLTAIDTDTHVE